MKQYRLKQWYPSLYDDIEVGTIVDYEDGWIYYTNTRGNKTSIEIDEEELSHKEFWELIVEKEPLFITEDGGKVFSDIDNLFAINLTYFSKTQNTLRSSRWLIDNPSYKVFSLESNADEYILFNKPVFRLHDIDFTFELNLEEFEKLEQLAIERVNEKI